MILEKSNALAEFFTMTNMMRAWEKVALRSAAPGIDGVSVEDFGRNWQERLRRLQARVLSGRYQPQPYLVFPKEKRSGGIRELVNATVADKIVGGVIAAELVERYDSRLQPQSYAYRPGRGALKAVSAVERHCSKATHVVRADIADFFDEIDHDLLASRLVQFGESEEVVEFILRCVRAPRFDGVENRRPERGVPQGSPLAPVLSNLYLDPLDAALSESHFCFVRYADDLAVLSGDADHANGALQQIQASLAELKLRLSVNKSRVYTMDEGFVFLGFLFTRRGKTPCREACDRVSERLQAPPYADESDAEYRDRLAAVRRGWTNYFGVEPEDGAAPVAEGDADSEADRTASTAAPAAEASDAMDSRAAEESGESAGLDSDSVDWEAEREAVLDLQQTGRYGHAIMRCRRLLNRMELDLPESDRADLFRILGDLYERQGLSGAARRCRESAGDKAVAPAAAGAAVPYSAEMVENWLNIFGHGQGPAACQYVDSLGRMGYRPASFALTARALRDHWQGIHTLAVPVYGPGNSVRFGVLDLDVTRRALDGMTAAQLGEKREALLNDAVGLVDLAHRAGVEGVIEDSGYKGYHVWFFFRHDLSARLARSFLNELCRVAGPPPADTHRELFPGSDTCPPDGVHARIKLPLGIHRLTGARCSFRNPDGSECTLIEASRMVRGRNDSQRLRAAVRLWQRWAPAASEAMGHSGDSAEAGKENSSPAGHGEDAAVATLLAKCSVLAGLRKKAMETGDLTHYERVVIRGILAPLGPAGREMVHAILRHCRNYDRGVTARMLGNGAAAPISCARIREILGDFADQVGCGCRFKPRKGEYAHPLRHLAGGSHPTGQEDSPQRALERPDGTSREPARPVEAGGRPADERIDGKEEKRIVGLLVKYHGLRRQLLELQESLQAAAGGPGGLRLSMGTLVAEKPDLELRQWEIRI